MNNHQRVTVNITNRTILRTIIWAVATILVFKFVGRVGHELLLIFISFFLALALNPVVGWISRRLRIKGRVKATAIAYILIIGLIALFLLAVTPPLVKQTRTFVSNVPQTIEKFQSQDSSLARLARRNNFDQKISDEAKSFASHYSNYGSTVFDTGKTIAEIIASTAAVLVLTFMMLVEGPNWMELIWGVMPEKNRKRHQKIAHKMYKGVTGFVNGQIILAVIAGIFAFIALEIASRIIGVSVNAVALAGIVSVFGLIPLFGNPLAAIVVILVCLINSLTLGLVMLIYFLVYFFIENHTFQPYIQSRLNNLTALTVFSAAIIGVGFGGLLGAIIAIPTATAVKILLEDYFEQHDHKIAPTHEPPQVG